MKISRRVSYILCLFVCCCSLITGCGKKESRVPNTKKSVEAVLQEQIEKEEKKETSTESTAEERKETEKTEEKSKVVKEVSKETKKKEKKTREKTEDTASSTEVEQENSEIKEEKQEDEKEIVQDTKEDSKEKKETKKQEKEVKEKESKDTKVKKDAKKTEDTKQEIKEEKEIKEPSKKKEETVKKEQKTSTIDYDLTKMNSDMIYATVFQMMIDPDSYIGKTIKMKGLYYASYNELNDKYYHFVVVADAAACCSQGIEFVWGDGSHVYPDEYPLDETEVEVTGVFEGYQEDGEDNTYYRLKNSVFRIM